MTEQHSAPVHGVVTAAISNACKLLIVDDECAIARIIQKAAAELGFLTRVVNDARIAIEAFLDFRPDVLALDLIMPGKDGIDVLNEVLLADPTVRLLLMSGYGDAALRMAGAVANIHRPNGTFALRKPFRLDGLRQILRHMAPSHCDIHPVGRELDCIT